MKTQKVFIDTTTTVSESKNNQMTNTGYFQHKARIPEISLNTALYRQVAHHLFLGIILETKLTFKKKDTKPYLSRKSLSTTAQISSRGFPIPNRTFSL